MSERRIPLLVTVAAALPWLTVVLPVYSFQTEQFDDEAVSLGSGSAGVFLLIPIIVMAVLAVVAWRRRVGVVWAVAAGAIAVVTGLLLIPLGQGSIIWDGVDAQGRPTGGYEVLLPDWGLLAMLLSLFLLVIAAVLVLRRRSAGRSG